MGAFTTGWRLDAIHLRGDEIYYRQAAVDIVDGNWLTNAQHPPLVKELMAVSHQLVGDTVVADRLPAALAAWATGLVIGVLVWRIGRAGSWSTVAGVAAALLWWAMPFGPARTATLEGVMAFLVVTAQLAWVHALARRDPRWLLVGGAVTGLAAACKLTGGVALIGLIPAAALLLRPRGERRVLPFAGLAVVVAALAWLFPFAPMNGDAVAAMTTPVTFQLEHAQIGHPVLVAGQSYQHSPVWSSLWFFVDKLGPLAAGGLTLAALLGWLRHGWRATPVAVTLLGFVIAISLSPVQLSHYQYVWWPLLVVLAGCALAPGRGSISPIRAGVVTLVAVIALVPLSVRAVAHVDEVARTSPTGLTLVPPIAHREVSADTAVVMWSDPWPTRTALPDQRLITTMPASLAPRALLVDTDWAARRDSTDLALWLDCRPVAYEEHDVGSMILFVRTAEPHPAHELEPWCTPLVPAT